MKAKIFTNFIEIINLDVVNSYYEVIFVDNGSTDSTGVKIDEIIQISSKLKNSNFYITKIKLPNNLGYGGGSSKALK